MCKMSSQTALQECIVLVRLQSLDALTPRLLDDVGDVGRVFVLPGTDDQPPRFLETLIAPAIPGDVGVELGAPPIGIRLGRHGVLWTTVPEAAIDEDRDPGSGEGDVGAARKGCDVHPVANTPTMQFMPEGEFRPGSRRREVRHEPADGRARCRRLVRYG